MDKKTSLIQNFINSRIWRKKWARVGGVMAAMVAFVTVYSLVLPAVTLTDELYCGIEEHVEHVDSCYERELVCELDESVLHQHTDACYELQSVLTCGEQEHPAHSHGDACYQSVEEYICGQEEGEEHTHTSECVQVYAELVCGQEESEGHEHTDGCYELQSVPVCGLEEGQPEHTHADDCYKKNLICEQQLHTHTLQCFSNPDADVEDAEIWERTVSAVTLTGSNAEDLVNIAGTQVGYHESADNFYVDADGTAQGWNRYGAWAGDPYAPWNEEFVAFCLEYAQVSDIALKDINDLEQTAKDFGEQYYVAGTYSPVAGDIVFLSETAAGSAKRLGIVSDLIMDETDNLTAILVIEGDAEGEVQSVEYQAGDTHIVAFGHLPEEAAEKTEEEIIEQTEEIEKLSEDGTALTETDAEGEPEEVEEITDYGFDGLYTEDEMAAMDSEKPLASASVTPVAQESEPTGILNTVKNFFSGMFKSKVRMTSLDDGAGTGEEEPGGAASEPKNWQFNLYYLRSSDPNYVEFHEKSFQIKYQMKFQTSDLIPANEVEIRIPASLFTDRDGGSYEPTKFGTPAISQEDYNNGSFQTARTTPFNVYKDLSTGELVFFNYRDLPAGTNAIWQVYFGTKDIMLVRDKTAWYAENNEEIEGEHIVQAVATVKNGGDPQRVGLGGFVTSDAKLTNVSLKATSKGQYGPILYTEHQVKTVAPHATDLDFDNYIYVLWEAGANAVCTQPWDLYMQCNPYYTYKDENEQEVTVRGKVINMAEGMRQVASGSRSTGIDNMTIVTAYPREHFDLTGTVMKNELNMTLHPVDNIRQNTKCEADADCMYQAFRWTYPRGQIGTYKYGSETYSGFTNIYKRVSDLERGAGNGRDYGSITSRVHNMILGYLWTHDVNTGSAPADSVQNVGTSDGSGTSQEVVNPSFGKLLPGKWVELTYTDDYQFAWVESGGSDVGKSKVLTKEDYYFSSVTVSRSDRSHNFYDGIYEDATPDSALPEPIDRSLYVYAMFAKDAGGNLITRDVDTDDDWELVATVPWDDSGSVSYTFSASEIAREPYRVKATHKTVDYSTGDISLTTCIKNDSPRFQEWYKNGAETIKVENLSGLHGGTNNLNIGYGEHGKRQPNPKSDAGDIWFWWDEIAMGNYQEDKVVPLSDFTKGLYYDMLLMRQNAVSTLTTVQERSGASKSAYTHNDAIKGRVDVTYNLSAWEGFRLNSVEETEIMRDIGLDTPVHRKHVEFYDLLPKDVQFDASKPVTASRVGGSSSEVTVKLKSIEDNWRDTGRVMLVFSVDYEGADPSVFSSDYWNTGYDVTFHAYSRWEEAPEALEKNNIAAYMSVPGEGPEAAAEFEVYQKILGQAYDDDGTGATGVYEPFSRGDLNDDGKVSEHNVKYMDTRSPADYPIAAESGIVKEVKSGTDIIGTFGKTATVNPNDAYLYRLTTSFADPGLYFGNLVVFDRLESAVPEGTAEEGTWHGIFAGVDTSDAVRQGYKPVVYYNTDSNAVLPDKGSLGASVLVEEKGWKLLPENLTEAEKVYPDVRAIAVDLTIGINGENMYMVQDEKDDNKPKSVYVDILMTAPNIPDGKEAAFPKHTYNEPVYSCTSQQKPGSTERIEEYLVEAGDPVTVTMEPLATFILEKTVDENAPQAAASSTFTFRMLDGDGNPYGNKLYKLYNKDDTITDGKELAILGTKDDGTLTLKADQKVVFKDAAAASLKAEELYTGFFWKPNIEEPENTGEKEITAHVFNQWRPSLFLQKKVDGLSRYEDPAKVDDTFYYRVSYRAEGETDWKPLAAGTEYRYVNKVNTSSYMEPVILDTGTVGDGGIIPIKVGQIITVSPGTVGTQYQVTEMYKDDAGNFCAVADSEIFTAESGARWASDDAEKEGTLNTYGSSEIITNTKAVKNVYLRKELTHQTVAECGNRTFRFHLEKKNASGEWENAEGVSWFAYETGAEVAADNPMVGVGGTIEQDGLVQVPAGKLIQFRDLDLAVYRLTEAVETTSPDYKLTAWKLDHANTKLNDDAQNLYGFEFELAMKDSDALATFTNDYRYRDLMVSKQVLPRNKDASVDTSKTFEMTLEKKVDGADGPEYKPVKEPYVIRDTLGKVIAVGMTGVDTETGSDIAPGTFRLASGQTATFANIDIVGTEYRIKETPDKDYQQILPNNPDPDSGENAPLLLQIGEDGVSGRFVNGSAGMIKLEKKWEGLDEHAQKWMETDGKKQLGIRLKFEVKGGDHQGSDWVALSAADRCFLLRIDNTTGELREPIALTSDTYDYTDPVNTSLVLYSDGAGSAASWPNWQYRVTESILTPEDQIIHFADEPNVTYALHLDKKTAEATGAFTKGGDENQAGDSVATLENTAQTEKLTWIRKYTANSGEIDESTYLKWRVERYTGSKWVPAAGVKYVVSYDSKTIFGSTYRITDGDGLITLTADPTLSEPREEGAPEPSAPPKYKVAVGFYVPVKLNFTKDMQQNDYRVVEVEDETDPAWGKLIAYGDLEGNYRIGGVMENPASFINDTATQVIHLQKVMTDDKPGKGPFWFELHKILEGRSIPGAELPYKLYNHSAPEGTPIFEGTTDAKGRLSLMSGQCALITIEQNVRWLINEDTADPEFGNHYLDSVTVTGDGDTTDTGVDITVGVRLKPGSELNGLFPADTVKVVFAYEDAVDTGEMEPLGIGDADDTGKIKLYYDSSSSTVYVVSVYSMIANTDCANMFRGLAKLESVEFSNLDLSPARLLDNMFMGCASLEDNPLNGQDTSRAVSAANLFNGCFSLTDADFSAMDISNLQNVAGMFANCSKLPNVDLTGLTPEKLTNVEYMFYGCKALENITAEDWTENPNVPAAAHVFDGCTSLVGGVAYTAGENAGKYCCSGTGYFDGSGKFNRIRFSGREINGLIKGNPDTDPALSSRYTSSDSKVKEITFGTRENQSANLTAGTISTRLDLCGRVMLHRVPNGSNFKVYILVEDPDDWLLFTDTSYMFYSCTGLTKLEIGNLNTGNVTDMSYMFYSCTGLTKLEIGNWKTGNVTDMSYMFYECKKLTSLDVSNFDTGNVTSMSYMFYQCFYQSYYPGELELGNWITDNVTDMSYMFYSCSGPTSLAVSQWNTEKVTDMRYMFCNCRSLTKLEIGNWKTGNVTDMRYMFYNCSGLTNLDLSNWNTGNVTDMRSMFESSGLTSLEVGNWNTGKVTDMSYMFQKTPVTSLGVDNWNTDNVTNMSSMFYECKSLTSLNVSKWTNGKVTDMSNMFYECNKLTNLDVSKWNTGNVTDMRQMFYNCNMLTNLDMSKWNTGNVTDMSYMFYECKQLTNLEIGNWNTGNVTKMSDMFYECTNLISLDVSKWNTGNVTTMSGMFYYCSKLTNLDVSKWNTGNVTDMGGGMFSRCSRLTRLEVGNWNTGNVTTMNSMFIDCTGLTSLEVGNWKTDNVTRMGYMFYNCSGLTSLDLSNWNTGNVTDMERMFYSCRGLTNLDLSNWNTGNVTNMSYMFQDCLGLTSLDLSGFMVKSNTNISSMFTNCGKLVTITARSWLPHNKNYGVFNYCRNLRGYIAYDPNQVSSDLCTPDVGYFTAPQTDNYLLSTSVSEIMKKSSITSLIVDLKENQSDMTVDPMPLDKLGHINLYISESKAWLLAESEDDWKLFTTTAGMFKEFTKLQTVRLLNFKVSNVTDMSEMFSGCTALTTLDVSGLNTSAVTDMSNMFRSCRSLTSLDLSNWNTGNVTNMSYMFYYCSGLTSLDVSNWNTGNVTNMSYMFYYCNKLTNWDVSKWNTGNVTDMSYMFSACKLTSLNLSNWNTGNVTNMSNMFSGSGTLTSLEVGNWDTGNVTNMNNMFSNCPGLTSLDAGNWNTGKVQFMSYMFYGCSELTKLDLSNWNTGNVTNMGSMFRECTKLTNLDVSNFDTGKVTNMSYMFYKCTGLTSPEVGNWNTGNVTNMSYMFYNCSGLTSLEVGNWNTGNVTDMSYMFYNYTGLTSLEVGNWDTDNVTNMQCMFYKCSKLTKLDVGNWNTDNVTNMQSMFNNCTGLTSLEVGNWNTGKVTSMGGMFNNCTGLTNLDVSNFDTGKVTSMSSMFSSCSGLTSLDLSNWNTGNVTNMQSMFKNCIGLTSLNASKWNTGNVTIMQYMFQGCSKLRTLDLIGWTVNNCSISNMFDSCTSLARIYAQDWTPKSSANVFKDCKKLQGEPGVGIVPYNSNKTDSICAKVKDGYFSTKNPSDDMLFAAVDRLRDHTEVQKVVLGLQEDYPSLTAAEPILWLDVDCRIGLYADGDTAYLLSAAKADWSRYRFLNGAFGDCTAIKEIILEASVAEFASEMGAMFDESTVTLTQK